MARLPHLVLILPAIRYISAKSALSTELTNLIPSCAHDCFTSFLDFNFVLGKCGINPTIGCLCTTKSFTDYTVGEGAVQCLLSVDDCGHLDDRRE